MTPAIASTHWYRFKAVLDMRARTDDVTVYDQGTAHPTAASPNDPEDPGLVLYDNLKVSTPSVLCIIVR